MIVYIQITECVLDNIINISTNVNKNGGKARKVVIIPKRPVGRIFSLKQQYRTVKKSLSYLIYNLFLVNGTWMEHTTFYRKYVAIHEQKLGIFQDFHPK